MSKAGKLVGPIQGFGPMWQKTYRVRLSGVSATPVEVMGVWKGTSPGSSRVRTVSIQAWLVFKPGEVVLLNASMIGAPVDSGLMVLYADNESLTLMTPEGCPEAGWIDAQCRTRRSWPSRPKSGPSAAPTIRFSIGFRLVGMHEQAKIWKMCWRNSPRTMTSRWPWNMPRPASIGAYSGRRWATSGRTPRCARLLPDGAAPRPGAQNRSPLTLSVVRLLSGMFHCALE